MARRLVDCGCGGRHYEGSSNQVNCPFSGRKGKDGKRGGISRYANPTRVTPATADDLQRAAMGAPLAARLATEGYSVEEVNLAFEELGIRIIPSPPDLTETDNGNSPFADVHGERMAGMVSEASAECGEGTKLAARMGDVKDGFSDLSDYYDWIDNESDPRTVAFNEAHNHIEEDEVTRTRVMAAVAPLVKPRIEVRRNSGWQPARHSESEWAGKLDDVYAGCEAAQMLRSMPAGNRRRRALSEPSEEVRQSLNGIVRTGASVFMDEIGSL